MEKKDKNKNILPGIKKKLSAFLTSEEGKITRKQAVKIASTLLAAGFAVSNSFSASIKNAVMTDTTNIAGSIQPAAFTKQHGSHASHGSHGSHSNVVDCDCSSCDCDCSSCGCGCDCGDCGCGCDCSDCGCSDCGC